MYKSKISNLVYLKTLFLLSGIVISLIFQYKSDTALPLILACLFFLMILLQKGSIFMINKDSVFFYEEYLLLRFKVKLFECKLDNIDSLNINKGHFKFLDVIIGGFLPFKKGDELEIIYERGKYKYINIYNVASKDLDEFLNRIRG